MRRLQPGLQPITLFEHLQDKYPGQYDKNHRTLQRRIKQWHALYGSDQEVIFRQQQQPGQQALVDFTVLKGIVILIAGSVLNFRLFHFRLAYCNWNLFRVSTLPLFNTLAISMTGLIKVITGCFLVPAAWVRPISLRPSAGNWWLTASGVRFYSATDLVQPLQEAKQALNLNELLLKLDWYRFLVIDDIGYVSRDQQETSVLFELIAHRYERASLIITANQPFSQWHSIFADTSMTVAAVDRLIHHAHIIELEGESQRRKAAQKRNNAAPGADVN